MDYLTDVLNDLDVFIGDIDSSIGNWKELDEPISSEDIVTYKKEDAILKDLVGSLQNVCNQFRQLVNH